MRQAFALEATVDSVGRVEEQLCEAFDTALDHALRRGESRILVPHRDHSRSTVAVGAEMPFDLTRQQRLWQHGSLWPA